MRAADLCGQELLGALALGVLQGLTEFLPVSSSGHLVVSGHLLGLQVQSLLFDVLLHLGTLLAVLVLYRREVLEILCAPRYLVRPSELAGAWRSDRGLRLGACVLLGSVPTGLMGVLLEARFEQLFTSLTAVGITFCITGGILMLTRLSPAAPVRPDSPSPSHDEPADGHLTLGVWRALAVGVAQGVAITPGISRSGTTIATGLLLGLERGTAARFSFLLSVPAILGAVALHLRKVTAVASPALAVYGAGTLVAALSGYLALRWLVQLVRRGALHWFALYLWPLGLAVLVWALAES